MYHMNELAPTAQKSVSPYKGKNINIHTRTRTHASHNNTIQSVPSNKRHSYLSPAECNKTDLQFTICHFHQLQLVQTAFSCKVFVILINE